jgi:hypothetical protein
MFAAFQQVLFEVFVPPYQQFTRIFGENSRSPTENSPYWL